MLYHYDLTIMLAEGGARRTGVAFFPPVPFHPSSRFPFLPRTTSLCVLGDKRALRLDPLDLLVEVDGLEEVADASILDACREVCTVVLELERSRSVHVFQDNSPSRTLDSTVDFHSILLLDVINRLDQRKRRHHEECTKDGQRGKALSGQVDALVVKGREAARGRHVLTGHEAAHFP